MLYGLNGGALGTIGPVPPQTNAWSLRCDASGNVFVRGTLTAAAFSSSSDRNLKENFTPVDARAVLDKVARLPLSQWSFKENPTDRHLGPMAQDFHAAFGLGPDDKHITTVDADGVALAAIQGLNQKLEEQRAENAALKRELTELKRLMNQLSDKLDAGTP